MNKATVGLLIISVLIFLVWYTNSTSKSAVSQDSNLLPKFENSENIDFYVLHFLKEVDDNYRLGNNKMIDGRDKSQIRSNSYGDVLSVSLSNEIYVAKGYFEKMTENLSRLEIRNPEFDQIRSKLIKAAKMRVESIELYSKGQYLKEQRGKISVAAMVNKTSISSLPDYHGEVEDSLAMLTVANSYIVDALNDIRSLTKETNGVDKWGSYLASNIAYYSDVSDSDYQGYVNDGNTALKNGDFFNAYISFYKASKLKPNEKGVLFGCIKSAIGLGDRQSAMEKYEVALKMYPNENELKQYTEILKVEEGELSQK